MKHIVQVETPYNVNYRYVNKGLENLYESFEMFGVDNYLNRDMRVDYLIHITLFDKPPKPEQLEEQQKIVLGTFNPKYPKWDMKVGTPIITYKEIKDVLSDETTIEKFMEILDDNKHDEPQCLYSDIQKTNITVT